jgi:hypothetical protein
MLAYVGFMGAAGRFLWGYIGDVWHRGWTLFIAIIGEIVGALLVFINPLLSLWVFSFFTAAATPVYWPIAGRWGKEYTATVGALGYIAMYLGAGMLAGKW